MRYRIQVTVGPGQLPTVIEAACKDNSDPNLRVEPVVDGPAAPALPPQTAAWTKPRRGIIRRLTPDGVKRQEVVERALKGGPKRWRELRAAISEAGLSEGTLNSLISKWQNEKKIRRSADGLWSLVD